jgi:biotin transport system substrate-specific component
MQSAIPSNSSLGQRSQHLAESIPGKVAIVVAATVFVAACAHVSFPLPFTPVPITLQTFAVILVGMVLGPVAGFSAMVLYLAEGAAGLPVFSPLGLGGVAQLHGPTAGYLFSYPLAAAAAGWMVRALGSLKSRFTRAIVAGIAADILLLTAGTVWLATFLHLSAATAWTMAVAPFLLGEALKITAAAGIFGSLEHWKRR